VIGARRFGAALLALALAGCSVPAERLYSEAGRLGLAPVVVVGGGFHMSAFHSPGSLRLDTLHVYLEGDGTPWDPPGVPATDPTPRDPLMLRLMALDHAPSLYLGRPCYDVHRRDPGCGPQLWTDGRYGEAVVEALAAALDGFATARGYREMLLFGHSGGGALALLLATRLQAVRAVVTLAVNYDIDAWADHHGYHRLGGSLNPALQAPVRVPEWHLLGGRDRRVPSRLMLEPLRRRPGARVEVVADFDHGCCWERLWPSLLGNLSRLVNAAMFAGHVKSLPPPPEH
jgi:pimeloyl-ACP methyl ester carboxylesterase